MIRRLPPVRWFRAAEDGVFRLASEVEYRLGITPRATKLVPTTRDRRIVRLLLLVVPALLSTFLVDVRPLRTRVLLVILVLVVLTLVFIFVADAFTPQKSSRAPAARPPARPPARRP